MYQIACLEWLQFVLGVFKIVRCDIRVLEHFLEIYRIFLELFLELGFNFLFCCISSHYFLIRMNFSGAFDMGSTSYSTHFHIRMNFFIAVDIGFDFLFPIILYWDELFQSLWNGIYLLIPHHLISELTILEFLMQNLSSHSTPFSFGMNYFRVFLYRIYLPIPHHLILGWTISAILKWDSSACHSSMFKFNVDIGGMSQLKYKGKVFCIRWLLKIWNYGR